LILGAVCACSPPSVGPAPQVDLALTDEESAALIRDLTDRVGEAPADAARRAALGMALESAAFWRAALESYEQARILDPSEPRHSYFAAIAMAQLGDLDGARRALDEVLASRPDYVPAQLFRGHWSYDSGAYDEALEAFERAVELDPESLAGQVGMARVLLQRRDGRAALSILEPLNERYRVPYVRQLLGRAHAQLGQRAEAEAALVGARPDSAPPGWSDPWNREKRAYQVGFAASLRMIEGLLIEGRPDEALVLLQPLLEERPDDPTLLDRLGQLHRIAGRFDAERDVLLQAVALHPEHYPFQLELAASYYRQGDVAGALRHAERAIEINPMLARGHARRAGYLLASGRPDEALEAFDTALTYDAGNPRVFFSAGALEAQRGNWSRAAERFQQALRGDPTMIAAYIGLGGARAELGEFEAAEQALRQAAAIDPDRAELRAVRRRIAELRGTP